MCDLMIKQPNGRYRVASSEEVLYEAKRLLEPSIRQKSVIDSPDAVRNYLACALQQKPYEVFGCLFLDNRHRVISFQEIFRGTINGASVHPREVVREAMNANAAAVIFAHNHPSGLPDPSEADKRITARLKDAVALIDVRVLDHMVIGKEGVFSFAEHGMI